MSDITRSEAIKRLKWFGEYNEEDYCGGDRIKIDGKWYYYVNKDDLKAFEMAISSLETDEAYNLMYEQPEFCEDCISRKAVFKIMDDIETAIHDGDGFQYSEWCRKVYELPSVLPKADKPSGKWIDIGIDGQYQCSNCNCLWEDSEENSYSEWVEIANYCPNCGARMESEDSNGSNN